MITQSPDHLYWAEDIQGLKVFEKDDGEFNGVYPLLASS